MRQGVAAEAAHQQAGVIGLDLVRELQDGLGHLVRKEVPVVDHVLLAFAQHHAVLAGAHLLLSGQPARFVAAPVPKRRLLERMIPHRIAVVPLAGAARAHVHRVDLLRIFPVQESQRVPDAPPSRLAPDRRAAGLGTVFEAVRALRVRLQEPVARIQLQNQRKVVVRRILDKLVHLPAQHVPVILSLAHPKLAELRVRHAQRAQYPARVHVHQANAALGKVARDARLRPERPKRHRGNHFPIDLDLRRAMFMNQSRIHTVILLSLTDRVGRAEQAEPAPTCCRRNHMNLSAID